MNYIQYILHVLYIFLLGPAVGEYFN